jgi:hypothetical protein
MIGIQLDGRDDFLDTEPGTTIRLTLENPILGGAEKLSPGSFSLPFNLPGADLSEKNSVALKNPDIVENNEAYQIQKATLYYDKNPFKKGNIKSNAFDGEKISAYFTFGLNSISPSLSTKSLRELVSEEKIISSASVDKVIYVNKIGSGDATIEINGISYTSNTESGLSVVIQNYFQANTILDGDVWLPWSDLKLVGDPTPQGIPVTYLEIRLARGVTDPFTLLPSLQYSTDPHSTLYVKLSDENKAKFQVEGFDMTDYYQSFQDFIDNAHTGTQLYFPVRFNANLHSGATIKQYEVINGVDAGGIIKNDPHWGFYNNQPLAIRNYNSIQPFLYLKFVLDKIATEFGFEYEGDFYEDPKTEKRIIDNSQTLDLLLDYLGDIKFIFWRRRFNVSELVPDWTVIEFLKAIQSRYNIAVWFNEVTGKVRMEYREPLAKRNDYEDITPITFKGSKKIPVQDKRITGFTFTVPPEDSDEFSVAETITVGIPQKPIDIKCGRLHREQTLMINDGLVRGVYVSQGNAQKFGLRIFNKMGTVNNGAYSYEAAHISGIDYEGLADFIFAQGIYSRYWKYWLHFEMNRLLVEVKVGFPFRRLLRFDWGLKRRFNRTNYLIKSIDVELTNQKMKVVSTELITMR